MGIPYAEVIGDPIAQSKSPLIHKFWLGKLGMQGDYRATRVTLDDLPAYLDDRRADPDWRGCSVTMPLKVAVSRLVEMDPVTKRIGAVNAVINQGEGRLLGTNTDWQGVHLSLDLDRLKPGCVTLVGAGGAARAVLEEIRQAGVPRLQLFNRTEAKARALLAEFGMAGEVAGLPASPTADLLVNASSLGMDGCPPLVVDLSGLMPDATVFDMVYKPACTPLLAAAQERGLRTIDGLTMLINQAAMAFTHFFKTPPDPVRTGELREYLAQ